MVRKGKKLRANKIAVVKLIKHCHAEEKLGLFYIIPRPKLEPKGRRSQKLSIRRSAIAKTFFSFYSRSKTYYLLKISFHSP